MSQGTGASAAAPSFLPGWVSRRLRRPSWLLPLWFLWFAWTCVPLTVVLLRSHVSTSILLWVYGVYLGLIGLAFLAGYALAVRYALLHPLTRRSRGVHLGIGGSAVVLLDMVGIFVSWGIPALGSGPFAVLGPALLWIGGIACASGFFLWLVEALDQICVR